MPHTLESADMRRPKLDLEEHAVMVGQRRFFQHVLEEMVNTLIQVNHV